MMATKVLPAIVRKLSGATTVLVLPHFAWIMLLKERAGVASQSWHDRTSGV